MKIEKKIAELYEDIRSAKTLRDRVDAMDKIKASMLEAKKSGQNLKKVTEFFKAKAEQTKEALKAAGQSVGKCCGE